MLYSGWYLWDYECVWFQFNSIQFKKSFVSPPLSNIHYGRARTALYIIRKSGKYAFLNKWVFNLALNDSKVCSWYWISSGSEFQSIGPETEKLRGPFQLFEFEAPQGHHGWQTCGLGEPDWPLPSTATRSNRTGHRREDIWRRGCRVWIRFFGEPGASVECSGYLRKSDRIFVFSWQGELRDRRTDSSLFSNSLLIPESRLLQ